MSNFTFKQEASKQVSKEELDYEYQLSENVIEDLIKYTRSVTVKNEKQFTLITLGYMTGFMESPKHFCSGCMIGTAGSGKSHIQNTLEKIVPEEYMYQTTTGSETSIIYDDTWNDAYIASLDELQKPGEKIIEILKSLHGGEDEEFVYKVTGDGMGADRDVDEIRRKAIPYWFLYAQYEPDFEMWDRLLKIPVHESKEKNRGVLRTQWDHSMIAFDDGSDTEYMYDFEDGKKALKDHIREMPKDAWVKIPAGEDEFGWDAVRHAEPIFDVSRSETNRVSMMVANLVRASCLMNHQHREKRRIKVRNDGVKEAYIAEPQDLANVLACREVLLATTHQLDHKRKLLCMAIEKAGGTHNAASIQSIQEKLKETNASFVKRHQIEAMLQDLEENYLVEKLDRAGENGRHLYQFKGWQNLGKFEIDDEFKRVFDGVIDPFTGEDFIESARRLNKELTPKASDFMGESNEVGVSTKNESSGQVTLGGESVDAPELDLEPFEELVHEMLKETLDGKTIDGLDEGEPTLKQMLGVVPMDAENDDEVDATGTIFDPDHAVWENGIEGWVEDVTDVENKIGGALTRLSTEGVLTHSVTKSRAGKPLAMKVKVKDVK